MSIEKQQKHINYEQSAGTGYEKKLGGLHADPERMQKILNPIIEYINSNQLDQLSIADLGGGSGNLLQFIKQQLEKDNPEFKITALNIDLNPQQLKATPKGIQPILADLEHLPIKNLDIEISRNVFHYLSPEEAEKAIQEAYASLKPGGIFINSFISSSTESQVPIDDFWTEFATKANIRKEETKRHFATKEEMEKMFKKIGFVNVHFETGFENIVIINGADGLAGKYLNLTGDEISDIEKHLLSLPENVRQEFNIKTIKITDDDKEIGTVTISQPVYIIYGEKSKN